MRIWLLGFPLDTFTTQDAEKKALSLADSFKNDGIPKYVAVLNVDFLVHSWGFYGVKNREFLVCLREADISVAEAKAFVFLSALLGCPLPMKVSREALFPELVETFALADKSLFLLGGSGELLKKFEVELLSHFPTSNIVGALAPAVYIEGDKIRDSFERDRLILSVIDKAKPDLLFIQLGAPKQELWFHRVKEELKVPLSIGLGGVFEKYTKQHESSSLLKKGTRCVKNIIKLLWLATPLVVYYKCLEAITKFSHIKNCPDLCQKSSLLFLSPKKTINVVRMPCLLDQERGHILREEIPTHIEHEVVLVDFKSLRFIDLYGCEALYKLWTEAKKQGIAIYGVNLRTDVKFLLKLNKLWDVIGMDIVDSPQEALNRMLVDSSLFMAVEQSWKGVHLYFLGALSSTPPYEKLLEQIFLLIESKALTVDLSYLNACDSRGEWFLIKMKEFQTAVGQNFKVINRE